MSETSFGKSSLFDQLEHFIRLETGPVGIGNSVGFRLGFPIPGLEQISLNIDEVYIILRLINPDNKAD